MKRRLLTISHSYVVALNRRFANELARVAPDDWEVTAVAPTSFAGDLRPIELERSGEEASRLQGVPAHLTSRAHVFLYGRQLVPILRASWDLIHVWGEPFTAVAAQVALLARRDTPIVFATFQNLTKRYPPPFRQIERYSMRRASGWIAFGHTVAATLASKPAYAARRTVTIPPGVDVSTFKPDAAAGADVRRSLGWTTDEIPVVGYMGRFIPSKGLSLLRDALEACTHPWRALFVGGGELEPELRAWASRFGDRVKLATSVSHDQVPGYLNAMDMLCAPSQTTPAWREQFGRMLTEAFACGVPVIASDSGEIPFTVGDAGIILSEHDRPAWTRAIDELLGDRGRRHHWAARGRARALSDFAWPVVARRTLSFFDEVVASPRSTRG